MTGSIFHYALPTTFIIVWIVCMIHAIITERNA